MSQDQWRGPGSTVQYSTYLSTVPYNKVSVTFTYTGCAELTKSTQFLHSAALITYCCQKALTESWCSHCILSGLRYFKSRYTRFGVLWWISWGWCTFAVPSHRHKMYWWAMPWPRKWAAHLSLQRPRFNPRPIHVGFVVGKVAMAFSACINQLVLHVHSFVYQWRYIIFPLDSIIK